MQQMSLAAGREVLQDPKPALCPQRIAELRRQERKEVDERMTGIEAKIAALRSKRMQMRARMESLGVDVMCAGKADDFWEEWVKEEAGFSERIREKGISSAEDARSLLALVCRQSAKLNDEGFFPSGVADPRSWAYYVKKARLDCVYLELCRALLASLKTCVFASYKRREVRQFLKRSIEKGKKHDLDEQAARLRVEELTARIMSLRPGRS